MDRVTAFFERIREIVQPIGEQFGGPGLALVAFFDSSFLSLPEASDVLVVLLTTRTPTLWWYYALMTTLGSVAGCFALYRIGRTGGEAFVRRRMRKGHVEWGMAVFKKYGLFAIIVPSLLPPPMPFKLFVFLAGVVNVRPATFVAAVVLGRGFRYATTAWLARTYGDEAFAFIRENLPAVSLAVAGVLVALGIGLVIWQRRVAGASE
jgi:membrane protein YqaA with SNARE-associated domain